MNINITILIKKRLSLLLWIIFVCALSACTKAAELNQAFYKMTTNKKFTDVIEDVKFAITERNYRVVNILEIGKAIKERGYHDFPNNSVVLFCNLTLARSMLEIEPHYINYCPGRISARWENEKVIITGNLYPVSGRNKELDNIVNEANVDIIEMVKYAAKDWAKK